MHLPPPLLGLLLASLLAAGAPPAEPAAPVALTSLVDELLRGLSAAQQQQQQVQQVSPPQPQPQQLNASRAKPPRPLLVPQANNQGPNQNSLGAVRHKWRRMEQALGQTLLESSNSLRRELGELLSQLQTASMNQSPSQACRSALLGALDALAQRRPWAAQMLDASARLPAGILSGSLTELGHFDQCLGVASSPEPATPPLSQYCSLQVRPALPARTRLHTVCQRLPALAASHPNSTSAAGSGRLLRQLSQHSHLFYYAGLRLGLCAPAACSRQDLQQLLAAYLAKFELSGQVRSCQTAIGEASERKLDPLQQCIVAVFAGLLILVLAATLADFCSLGERRKSTVISNSDKTAAAGDQEAPRAKRWHYQVYQTGPLLADNLVGCSHLPGVQRNPLLGGGGQPRRCSPQSTDNLEEAWISQLERDHFSSAASATSRQDQGAAKTLSPRPAPPSPLLQLLACFSLRLSLKTIGRHLPAEDGLANIKAVHGLRTLAMVWVIFGHSVGLVSPEMLNSLFAMARQACSSRLLQALLNATLAVNSFFMISGFVTAVSIGRRCRSSLELATGCKQHQAGKLASDNNPNCSKLRQDRRRRRRRQERAEQTKKAAASSSRRSSAGSLSSNGGGGSSCGQPGKARVAEDAASLDSSASIISPSASSSSAASSISRRRRQGWPSDFRPLWWLAMRYLRLTPAYAATLGLAILLPALGSGPFWQESAGQLAPACRAHWWTNLLYVNNFVATDRLCLIHSWYLSNDFQFYLLTLLLLASLYKSRKLACVLLGGALAASSAATFALTVANDFPPTIVSTSPALAERWLFIHSLYYKPWPHLPSYLVGLVAGYCLLVRESRQDHQESTTLGAGPRRLVWILAALLALALLNSIYPWNMGLQVDPYLSGLHAATFRTLWSGCGAWLLYALARSPKSSWLGKLLGWHGFQVTSRLTYCAYLVHPLLIYYHFGTVRERLDSSLYGQLHRFVATLGLSYLSALLLALLVEAPSARLQHYLATGSLASGGERPCDVSGETHQRKTAATSSAGSTGSWTGTSSFGGDHQSAGLQLQQSNPLGSLKLLGSASTSGSPPLEPPPPPAPISSNQNSFSVSLASLSPGSGQVTTDQSHPSTSAAAALDADFQRKLAQAIGRGFRIRSRMAAASAAGSTASNTASRAPAPKRSPTAPLDPQQAAALPQLRPAARRVEFSTFFASTVATAAAAAKTGQQPSAKIS